MMEKEGKDDLSLRGFGLERMCEPWWLRPKSVHNELLSLHYAANIKMV